MGLWERCVYSELAFTYINPLMIAN